MTWDKKDVVAPVNIQIGTPSSTDWGTWNTTFPVVWSVVAATNIASTSILVRESRERKDTIMKCIIKLARIFQIETSQDSRLERSIFDGTKLHSFDFFEKVHSQIEWEGIKGLRGYILRTWNHTTFFTYQPGITKENIASQIAGLVTFDRIICLDDIMSHSERENIMVFLQLIGDIEKQNRVKAWIATTPADIVSHTIIIPEE